MNRKKFELEQSISDANEQLALTRATLQKQDEEMQQLEIQIKELEASTDLSFLNLKNKELSEASEQYNNTIKDANNWLKSYLEICLTLKNEDESEDLEMFLVTLRFNILINETKVLVDIVSQKKLFFL